jgi:hypothetical protein
MNISKANISCHRTVKWDVEFRSGRDGTVDDAAKTTQ